MVNKINISSIYSNTNLRYILKKQTSYVNLYIEKLLTNLNAVSPDPKIIIVNSTYGGGKSVISKNLSTYFTFYKADNYIHIDQDEFIMSIIPYKNIIRRISEYLTLNVLNKKLNSYGIPELVRYGDLTANDLITTKAFNNLSVEDYRRIYDYIQNLPFERTGKTIREISDESYQKYRTYQNEMLKNVFEICKYMKYNIVFEVGLLNYGALFNMINDRDRAGNVTKNIADNNWYYICYNYNPKTKPYILKNVLKRNIETGRLLSFDIVTRSFDNIPNIINDYKIRLPKNNMILIEQGYIMPDIIQLTNDQIRVRTKTVEVRFNENFDPRCGSRIPFNLTNVHDTFSTICKNKVLRNNPGIQNRNNQKQIGTDSNTKYLFDENTTALVILNTFDQLQQSIRQIIGYYNTIPDIPHQLVEEDIKVVLKGGLNIRLYLKKFISIIQNIINDKKTKQTISVEQQKAVEKLMNFFNDFDIENPNILFSKIISR